MLNYELFLNENKEAQYIVLLHGFGGNHRIWKHQIPILQKYFNVLAIDLPSHNEKNIKLSNMKNTIDAVVQKILEVLKTFDVKKAIFMGVSLGTLFIKHLELYYTEFVECGILVGAVGQLNWLFSGIVKIFSKIGDRLPFKFVYKIFSKVIMPMRSSIKSRQIFCKCAEALNAKEFKSWMNIFVESISLNLKFKKDKHIHNLYISGDADICFLKEIRKEADATSAKIIEMESCGHICNIDQRETFNKILEDFLKNHLFAHNNAF